MDVRLYDKTKLRIEVKRLSGNSQQIEVSPNEYAAFHFSERDRECLSENQQMNLQEAFRQLAQNRLDHQAELNALTGSLESIKVILWELARTQQQSTTL